MPLSYILMDLFSHAVYIVEIALQVLLGCTIYFFSYSNNKCRFNPCSIAKQRNEERVWSVCSRQILFSPWWKAPHSFSLPTLCPYNHDLHPESCMKRELCVSRTRAVTCIDYTLLCSEIKERGEGLEFHHSRQISQSQMAYPSLP